MANSLHIRRPTPQVFVMFYQWLSSGLISPLLSLAFSPFLWIAIALFCFKNFCVVCPQARYLSLTCVRSRGKPSKTFERLWWWRLELPVPPRPPHLVSLFWRQYHVWKYACVQQKHLHVCCESDSAAFETKAGRVLIMSCSLCLVSVLIDSQYQSALIYPRHIIHLITIKMYDCIRTLIVSLPAAMMDCRSWAVPFLHFLLVSSSPTHPSPSVLRHTST